MSTKMQLLSIILVAIGLSAAAQSKRATNLLDEAANKIRGYSSFRIEFTYSMQNKSQGINESYSGILISKGDKYRIEVAGQQIVSDGITIWTYLESVNELKINSVDESTQSFTPTNFLLYWKNDYKPIAVKESSNSTTILLEPLRPGAFNRVEIELVLPGNNLRAIRLSDFSGNEFAYIVKKLTPNVAVKDTDFVFDLSKHPNIEVIDLR